MEFATVGKIESRDVLGVDQVNFVVSGVNISFLTKLEHSSPVKKPVELLARFYQYLGM